MMERKCKICGKTNGLFSLEFEADETDAGEEWTSFLCGTCWEHIAAVARRVVKPQVEELERKISEINQALEGVYFRNA